MPIAVATSSSDRCVSIKTLRYKSLFSLFHHIVAASSDPEIKRGKPDPEVFLICAKRFSDKPDPEKVMKKLMDFLSNDVGVTH